MKPTIVFHGNCQSYTFYTMAMKDARLTEEYTIGLLRISDGDGPRQFEMLCTEPVKASELLSNCAIFFQQKSLWAMTCGYAERLPPGCRKVSFPMLSLELLWPFYMLRPYPRPFGLEDNRRGHGDRILHNLIKKGLPSLETLARFMGSDIHRSLDLDRAYDLYFDKLRTLDQEVDVPVAGLIEDSFRHRQLFVDPAHPSVPFCYYMASQIFRCAGLMEEGFIQNWDGFFSFSPTFPIHPQVMEHYGLTWVDHHTRYAFHAPRPYANSVYQEKFKTKEGDYGYLAGLRKHLEMPDVLPCRGREDASERILSLQEELAFWEALPEGAMAKTVAAWRAELLTVLADCHHHLGEMDKARALYQRALDLDTAIYHLLPSLLEFLGRESRFEEALVLLRHFIDGPNMRYCSIEEKMFLAKSCVDYSESLAKHYLGVSDPEKLESSRSTVQSMKSYLNKIMVITERQSTPPLENISNRLGQIIDLSDPVFWGGLVWVYEPFQGAGGEKTPSERVFLP
ncbi:MAG: hypothetical protein HQL64_09575 [Magnetococcales bacterium]|nr:hypothetical protein [Magnetococcales bacterium]